jgi:hypothetical protein
MALDMFIQIMKSYKSTLVMEVKIDLMKELDVLKES